MSINLADYPATNLFVRLAYEMKCPKIEQLLVIKEKEMLDRLEKILSFNLPKNEWEVAMKHWINLYTTECAEDHDMLNELLYHSLVGYDE